MRGEKTQLQVACSRCHEILHASSGRLGAMFGYVSTLSESGGICRGASHVEDVLEIMDGASAGSEDQYATSCSGQLQEYTSF